MISRKMIANETIKPLPTSFALQENERQQIFDYAHKPLEAPVMQGPKVVEHSEVTQFMYSQTDQSMMLLENSVVNKHSLAPKDSFERLSVAKFGQWMPDLENIISERSHVGAGSIPNYQNVQRNTLVFQPVKHKRSTHAFH